MISAGSPARRGHRGSLLAFMLIALPLMLLGVSLATDYARSVLVNRQAGDVAEAVAMAGATGFSTTSEGTLNPQEARGRAQAMYAQARSVGMITVDGISPPSINIQNGNRTIQVSIPTETRLLIPSALLRLAGQQPVSLKATITRRASICQPSNRGGCMYPTRAG